MIIAQKIASIYRFQLPFLGLTLDMLYFVSDPIFTKHNTGLKHPEQPARTVVIESALQQRGLKKSENSLKPREATEEELLLCHPKEYVDLVKREISALRPQQLAFLSTGDVVISPDSWKAALYAVGGVLCAIDRVLQEPDARAFCIVRPPGHHACSTQGMGFCLFNNVAIGARYAQKKYGIKRVLIADWDVHHGNGTQEIFYRDPSIFYFSTHEKDLYPFTGTPEETGAGNIWNCPIAPSHKSREEVIAAFESLEQRMQTFKPELVLISAGFDAHREDPLGHFNLTTEDFETLGFIVKKIALAHAKGRLVSVLEGGYNLQAIADSAVAHARGIL